MKERITITVDNDLLKWIDAKIEKRVFASRSHGFEFLIQQNIDEETDKDLCRRMESE